MAFEATVKTVVLLGVTCEHCGHQYKHEHLVVATATSEGECSDGGEATNAARRNLEALIAQRVAERKLGHKVCPQCGYLQSWMQDSWGTNRAAMTGLVVAVAIGSPCAVGITVDKGGFPGLLTIVSPFLMFSVFGFILGRILFVPNKRWQRKHGALPARRLVPVVVGSRKPD